MTDGLRVGGHSPSFKPRDARGRWQ